MSQLLDVAHVSKHGASVRITLPRLVVEKLEVNLGGIVGFYEEDGRIFITKMK